MTVRSVLLFLRGSLESGDFRTLWTTPPERTALLKGVRLHNDGATAQEGTLVLALPGQPGVFLHQETFQPRTGRTLDMSSCVVPPDASLLLYVHPGPGVQAFHAVGWGSLLSGVAPP